jgi:hypothetical protein
MSTFGSTHIPWQAFVPVAQVQLPPTQTEPLRHVDPQSPQLSLSTSRSTHIPPQGTSGGTQGAPQTPWMHMFDAHTTPHPPQSAGELSRSAQWL